MAAAWYELNTARRPTPPAYPSNLCGARNVGARSGSGLERADPLDDIFDRGRQK